MAIKFSQFVVETSASTMSHIVGYDGADNIQITPNNFFTSFVTGTAGQVPFFGSTTSLLGDDDFSWDNTNKRLGIGTSSPAVQLHVAGTGAPDIRVQDLDGTNQFINIGHNNGNTTYVSRNNTSFGTHVFYGANGSATTERMRIASTGNVGIGTSSPGTTLDVVGTLASSGITQLGTGGSNVLLTSAGGGNVGIGTSSPGVKLDVRKNQAGYTYIASDNANTAASGTGSGFAMTEGGTVAWYLRNERDGSGKFNIGNSANRLTIDSSGNLGIGTTSPATKLQISAANASSPTANIFLDIDGSNQTGMGGQIIFGTSTSASATQYIAAIQGVRNGLDNGSSDIHFQTTHVATAIAPTTKMTILSSGNVGIGTSSPTFKLDVEADSSSGVVSVKNAANGRDTFRSENAAGTRTLNFGNDGSGHGLLLIRNSSGSVTNYIAGSGDSYFTGGNVGIGTSSPTKELQVNGEALFGNGTNGLLLSYSGTNSSGIIDTGHSSTALEFRVGNTQELLINGSSATFAGTITTTSTATGAITLNGGTGVSTTGAFILRQNGDGSGNGMAITSSHATSHRIWKDANGVLNIGSSGNANAFQQDITGNATFAGTITIPDYIVHDGDTNTKFGFGGNDSFQVNTSGTAQFSIDTSGNATFAGNVGIGTASPQSKLHIENSSGANIILNSNTASAGGGIYMTEGSSGTPLTTGAHVYYDGGGNLFKIDTGTSSLTTRFVITRDTGNVGIGTSTPTAKLTVVGLAEHADNAAAISAGLTTGAFYRTGDLLKVVH